MVSETEMIKKVIDHAVLKSIHLKSSTSNIVLPPNFVTPDLSKVEIDYKFSHVFEREAKLLFSFVAIEVIGILSAEGKANNPNMIIDNDKLFSCHSVFVATYSVNADLNGDECEAFTKTNALFNVYPYLREHVNSEFTKMGLLGIYLPLLKPTKTNGEAASQEMK